MTEPNEIAAWFGAAGAREEELRRVDELVTAAAPGIDRQLGKSCIRFTSLDAVDADALAVLVRDAVAATAVGDNGFSAA